MRVRRMIWPVLLLALLAVLAWLQYQWTGQISRAEQERMRESARSSMRRFAADADDEIGQLFRYFRHEHSPELGARLGEQWESYQEDSRYPNLIADIYFSATDRTLSRLNASRELERVAWPDRFARVRDRLPSPKAGSTISRMGRPERGRRGGPPIPIPMVFGAPRLVAVPVASRTARPPGIAVSGYVLVELDPSVLQRSVFPELAARHFGEDYDVVVLDRQSAVVFSTSDDASIVSAPDVRGELWSVIRGLRPPRWGDRRRGRSPELSNTRRELGEGRLLLFARHRAGSLEAAVATVRTRNLAVSFGVLGLLAASIVLVSVSTRRAAELTDRKVEFIAGVSHELRTPVAVLRSAGQNLADGSVSDPDQVRRYGSLIETEGRRLNDLVEQVLELGGIQSQKRRLRREPVSANALVETALSDCESYREERGVPVDTQFAAGALVMRGEVDALRRAVGNIIMNALKHGGDDNRVEVKTEARGSEVAVIVSDRGPGIPDHDKGHLFDAFYRGTRARERQVPGSGLGLSLVEQVAREHGGRVAVESADGGGSRFTLLIPAN